jgi:glycine hydroxymethyltransferase
MLESFDPEIYSLIQGVDRVGRTVVPLHPGRNFLSLPVLNALGSSLSDQFLEGGIGRRYSGTSPESEEIERLGRERLIKLFDAEAGSLQPQNHAQAVAAALEGLLETDSVVMAPAPGQGCSLVFGHPSTLWAKRFRFVRYGPDPESMLFCPESLESLALACRPSMIVVSLHPYPRNQDLSFWRDLADRVHALLLVDLSTSSGLVPGGLFPSLAKRADVVTGATQGLLRGPPGGFLLYKRIHAENIERGLFPLLQTGCSVNGLAAKAVAIKEAASPAFVPYVKKCLSNAAALSRALRDRGLEIWTQGTDFHYLVLNVRTMGLSGLEAERRLSEAGFLTCRVQIPFGLGCANQGDGIILATQGVTLKGVEPQDLDRWADEIYLVLK